MIWGQPVCRRQRNPESQASKGTCVESKAGRAGEQRLFYLGGCPFISLRSDPKGDGPRLGKKKQSRARLKRAVPTS